MSAVQPLFDAWLAHYGPQRWWPGESPFEVMVGAVLVQRTSWANAARAIAALQERRLLDSSRLLRLSLDELGEAIAPAGFFRVKAARLASLARFVEDEGGIGEIERLPTGTLRSKLLSIHGVGEETADAILLYAFDRPVVVIDAYLRRILERVRGSAGQVHDDAIRREVLSSIDDARGLNELHALAVIHGKTACRKKPMCEACCVRAHCSTGRRL